MALDELVSRSITVVRADAWAHDARPLIEAAITRHVVVERHEGDRTYWYVFPIEQVRARLRQGDDGPLADLLGLHEWTASPTVEADAVAGGAPLGAIVLRDGQAIGVFDPGTGAQASGGGGAAAEPPTGAEANGGGGVAAEPPAQEEHRPVTRGQHAKPPAPEPPATGAGTAVRGRPAEAPRRSVEAEFPDTVMADAVEWLLVSIVNAAPTATGIGISLAAGETIDILVQPRRGFVVEGDSHGSLEVPASGESLPLQFKLRAVDEGTGLIRVLAFSRGEPLGVITLEPTVEPAAAASPGGRAAPAGQRSAQALAQASARIPDLSMFIEERETGGKLEFTIRLSASDPTLDLNLRPFGPFTLQVDPSAFFESFFQEIEELPIDTPDERAIADRRLAAKGAYLTETLMPAELRQTMWDLRAKLTSIVVQSEEPWIPWELCRLVGKGDDGRTVEGPFLCEAFAITRWLPGLGFKRPLRVNNLALVVPGDSGLPLAVAERDYVLSLAGAGRAVTAIDPTFTKVQDAFVAGTYDAWHFTGHGASKAANPDQSSIILAGNEALSPEDVSGQAANVGLAHPLVFINACQIGRGGMALTGIGGWARRFAQVGAGAFIGAYWSVYDEAAFAFAKEVYTRLLGGTPIGEAVRQARIAVRADGDPTWLAYTVFADPLASVEATPA